MSSTVKVELSVVLRLQCPSSLGFVFGFGCLVVHIRDVLANSIYSSSHSIALLLWLLVLHHWLHAHQLIQYYIVLILMLHCPIFLLIQNICSSIQILAASKLALHISYFWRMRASAKLALNLICASYWAILGIQLLSQLERIGCCAIVVHSSLIDVTHHILNLNRWLRRNALFRRLLSYTRC